MAGGGIGRVAADADVEAIASLLMGACFQQGFLRYFEGGPGGPDVTDSVAETLVHPLLPALLP